MAVSPVFYQVKPQNLPLYIDLGLNLSKLGEEARVDLGTFSLEGAARADLRQTHRRASRDGAQFEVIPRTAVAAVLGELRAVSDAWLAEKKTAEKRFSLGFFDERYLQNFDCGVVRRGGAIVAFANLWRGGLSELSVDLMRYGGDAPKGVIDYLLIECMLWGRTQGFQWFKPGNGSVVGFGRACARTDLAQGWPHGAALRRDVLSLRGPEKVQGEIPAGLAPALSRGAGWAAMAGALLDVTAPHLRRRRQGAEKVMPRPMP